MNIASEQLAKTVFSTKVQRLLSDILGAVDETSDADDSLPKTEHTQRISTQLDWGLACTWLPMFHTAYKPSIYFRLTNQTSESFYLARKTKKAQAWSRMLLTRSNKRKVISEHCVHEDYQTMEDY